MKTSGGSCAGIAVQPRQAGVRALLELTSVLTAAEALHRRSITAQAGNDANQLG
jgi:hypothetical protein